MLSPVPCVWVKMSEKQERCGRNRSFDPAEPAEAAQEPECQNPKYLSLEELRKFSNRAQEAEQAFKSVESNDGECELHSVSIRRPVQTRRRLTFGARIKSTFSAWSTMAGYPLLTTPSKFYSFESSRLSESPSGGMMANRRNPAVMMPEYGKLARLLSVCVAVTICLSIYQEVVQQKGLSGCSPAALGELSTSSKHCSDVRLYHVYMPLFTRQVESTDVAATLYVVPPTPKSPGAKLSPNHTRTNFRTQTSPNVHAHAQFSH